MTKNISILNSIGNKTTLGVKSSKAINIACLKYAPDKIEIKHSPLSEFQKYIEGYKIFGEKYIPKSDNPNSVFMEYYKYRSNICKPTEAKIVGGFSIKAQPAPPKILMKSDKPDSYIISLMKFQEFIETKSKYATKTDYQTIVNKIANMMPKYVKNKHPQLKREIIDNSGKIYKWRSTLSQESKDIRGNIIRTRFYNETEKNNSINEYKKFVETLTGKKVLIGCPTRISIAIDNLGLLNDTKSYKDVDYILFGHGKGSSLIKDTKNPNSWRFSDNNKSVWEFIEENVPKGKKILVGVCEQDKFFNKNDVTRTIPKERKMMPEMYDKSGNYMFGIGNTVSTAFSEHNPAKICESGKRHIIGHTYLEPKGLDFIESFINSVCGSANTKYYTL